MKRKLLTTILLGAIMLTGCGGPAAEATSEATTAVEAEDAKDDAEKNDADEDIADEAESAATDDGTAATSTEDGTYVVFTHGDESYPYHFYTDSNAYSKYDYTLDINGPGEKSSFVKASDGELSLENLENGQEATIPTDTIYINHFDFDAVKDQEVSEGFTFANYLENFMPYADTELDKYNFAIRIKKDDYSSEEFDQHKLIYNNSNYEYVVLMFRTADEFESYDKSPMSNDSGAEYTTEEFEMNGYPVMIHTYTYESKNDAFNTEKPNYSNYIATVKLSDDVFVNVETVSALNTDEVKALVQKYVFDAMDL